MALTGGGPTKLLNDDGYVGGAFIPPKPYPIAPKGSSTDGIGGIYIYGTD